MAVPIAYVVLALVFFFYALAYSILYYLEFDDQEPGKWVYDVVVGQRWFRATFRYLVYFNFTVLLFSFIFAFLLVLLATLASPLDYLPLFIAIISVVISAYSLYQKAQAFAEKIRNDLLEFTTEAKNSGERVKQNSERAVDSIMATLGLSETQIWAATIFAIIALALVVGFLYIGMQVLLSVGASGSIDALIKGGSSIIAAFSTMKVAEPKSKVMQQSTLKKMYTATDTAVKKQQARLDAAEKREKELADEAIAIAKDPEGYAKRKALERIEQEADQQFLDNGKLGDFSLPAGGAGGAGGKGGGGGAKGGGKGKK